MKDATNILRKATPSWMPAPLDPKNPDHWEIPEDHKEHQLLNQPEHKDKGWVSKPQPYYSSGVPDQSSGFRDHDIHMARPYSREKRPIDDWKRDISLYQRRARILENKVKAVELKTGGHTHQGRVVGSSLDRLYDEGRFHHVIHRNPHYGKRNPHYETQQTQWRLHPWMTTHVDTHTGQVVGRSSSNSLGDALNDRHSPYSFDTNLDFPAAHITKIHYHDDKEHLYNQPPLPRLQMKKAIDILRKGQQGYPFTIHSPGSEGDFHIHSIGDKAGKPAKEPSATTYAVRVDKTVLNPSFTRYAFEHAHSTGRFKPYMRGSVISRVNVGDAHKAMVEHFQSLYGSK